MPGLLHWDAINQLERLEGEMDQFETSSKAFWKTTQGLPQLTLPAHVQRPTILKLPRLHGAPCSRPPCYRFFFFPKMSFQLSL
jgi:hypothetical protein